MGCCVSHISLGLSISIPDTGRRQGEIERQLLLLLCPLSSCYLSRRRIKGTNYILPQTFGLMSKQGSVVISALSLQPPCFSLSRATCSRARNWCDPACMDSSRGTANPFICCRCSYLPHGEPASLRPAWTPPRQGYPSQTLCVCTNTKQERAGIRGTARRGDRVLQKTKTQTNPGKKWPNLTRDTEPGSASLPKSEIIGREERERERGGEELREF